MSLRNLSCSAIFLSLLASILFIQATLLHAQVPVEPVEMVTTSAHPFDSATERATVLGLLERARQNISLYGPGSTPFVLHLTFNASGEVRYTGEGELTEHYVAMGRTRWTARLADYSQDRLFLGRQMFDQNPGPVPLRLQMVGAVFNPMPGNWAHRAIRLAGVTWKGRELMCVLLAGNNSTLDPGPRRWDETEFCVDKGSGLLQTYSPAPGLYAAYNYQDAVRLNDRTLPREITFSEQGTPVLQIRIESLTAFVATENVFAPSPEMRSHQDTGPMLLAPPLRLVRDIALAPGSTSQVQSVIVHASVDPTGKVLEAEALSASQPEDVQPALAAIQQADLSSHLEADSRQQRQAFIYVRFVPGSSATSR